MTRIAERAVEDGRPWDGADEALTKAFRALAEADLSRARPSPAVRRAVVEQFHRLYYHSSRQTWKNTRFHGVAVWKNPMDLWLYQELIHEFRPDVIVEAGTKYGGSAYYFARLFDLVGHGQVITIDTKPQPNRPAHPRITYLTGSSTDPAIAASVDELVGGGKPLIVLDSSHRRDHVLEALRLWSPRVPLGWHIVVEDSHAGGHPVTTRVARGPWPAIKRFSRKTTRSSSLSPCTSSSSRSTPAGTSSECAEIARCHDRALGLRHRRRTVDRGGSN